MANIKVNKEIFVNGKLAIEREAIENESGENTIVTKGAFTTHDYFEEIHTLESERYLLQNIEVYKEHFGSNDYDIGYEFLIGSLTIKEDYIPQEIKNLIEAIKYEDEQEEYYHSKNWESALDLYEKILREVSGSEGGEE